MNENKIFDVIIKDNKDNDSQYIICYCNSIIF